MIIIFFFFYKIIVERIDSISGLCENGNVREGKSAIRHWSVNRSFIDCDVVRRVGGR